MNAVKSRANYQFTQELLKHTMKAKVKFCFSVPSAGIAEIEQT